MGFLQQDVGYGSGDGESRLKKYGKAVTVISLAQAEAALSAAESMDVGVLLISAPDAAGNVGPGWFDALVVLASSSFPAARYEVLLDCGNAPGDAMAALRHGFKHIRYKGTKQAAISDIARKHGAHIVENRPDALDLQKVEVNCENVADACRSWLSD